MSQNCRQAIYECKDQQNPFPFPVPSIPQPDTLWRAKGSLACPGPPINLVFSQESQHTLAWLKQWVASGCSCIVPQETAGWVCTPQQCEVTPQVRGQGWLEQPWRAVSGPALPLLLAEPLTG